MKPRPHVFRTAQEAELAYEDKQRAPPGHRASTGRLPGTTSPRPSGRILFNDRIERALAETLGDEFDPTEHEFINQTLTKREIGTLVATLVFSYGAPSIALVLDAFKDLGFHYASQAGITISKNDVVTPARQGADPRALRERGRRRSSPSTTRA